MKTDLEHLVVSRVVEKIQTILDEESRQEEERILKGDPNGAKPTGILYASEVKHVG